MAGCEAPPAPPSGLTSYAGTDLIGGADSDLIGAADRDLVGGLDQPRRERR